MTEKHEHEQDIVWLSQSEAARKLGISQSTVSAYVKQKKIASKRDELDNRLVLVNVTELERLLKEREKHLKGE